MLLLAPSGTAAERYNWGPRKRLGEGKDGRLTSAAYRPRPMQDVISFRGPMGPSVRAQRTYEPDIEEGNTT